MAVLKQICFEIPFGLSYGELVSNQEPEEYARSLEEEMAWLLDMVRDENPILPPEEELRHILRAAVAANEAGVPLTRALHTAIVWMRG